MTDPLLRKLESLSSLSTGEKQALSEAVMTRTRTYGADEDIASEGDRPKDCTIVLDGMVCQYKLVPQGRRQIIGFQLPGDAADLSGCISGRMDHSVAAVTATTVAVIPYAALKVMAAKHAGIAHALWKETLADAAIAREWVVNLGRRTAYERIAHLICEIGARLRRVGRASDGMFEWPLTQEEIADATGLSTVHVNRVLQHLRRDGLITLRDRQIVIHDWNRLRAVAQFAPDYLFTS